MSKFYELTDAQKMHYGAISYGGSNGLLTPNATLGTNKWIGLRVESDGELNVRKANGQTQLINVTVGEYVPYAIDTLFISLTTATCHGLSAWDEEILGQYK